MFLSPHSSSFLFVSKTQLPESTARHRLHVLAHMEIVGSVIVYEMCGPDARCPEITSIREWCCVNTAELKAYVRGAKPTEQRKWSKQKKSRMIRLACDLWLDCRWETHTYATDPCVCVCVHTVKHLQHLINQLFAWQLDWQLVLALCLYLSHTHEHTHLTLRSRDCLIPPALPETDNCWIDSVLALSHTHTLQIMSDNELK